MTTPSTITGRVAEFHATMAAGPPREVMGAFSREQAALAAVEPTGIAKIGTILADTELLDATAASAGSNVHPDYSTRTEPRQILGALAHLGY